MLSFLMQIKSFATQSTKLMFWQIIWRWFMFVTYIITIDYINGDDVQKMLTKMVRIDDDKNLKSIVSELLTVVFSKYINLEDEIVEGPNYFLWNENDNSQIRVDVKRAIIGH